MSGVTAKFKQSCYESADCGSIVMNWLVFYFWKKKKKVLSPCDIKKELERFHSQIIVKNK